MAALAMCLEWYEEQMGECGASYHRLLEYTLKMNERIGKDVTTLEEEWAKKCKTKS